MEHSELIAEMAYIEKLSTQERLKLARRRRMQQLKKCSQREKEAFGSKREKTIINEAKKKKDKWKAVKFISNVMLLEAAARNDIDEVRELLEAGVDPDSTNEDGLTALHQCCIDDSEEMMKLLVHHGANVNAQDSERWTPLHAAATCGHLHLAKFLIAKGANLLAVNADGNMPYDICEDDATLDYIEGEMAHCGVTQNLIDDTRAATEVQMLNDLKELKLQGKSLLYRDEQGATPLHIAAANGYVRVVDYLLSQNVPTDMRDSDDWVPLHAAACWGHLDVLELLVQSGASLKSRTKNQETPYDICEDIEIRERILQLINEQETKRLHDQQKKIRRSHSNTRTQSVRRTSIREKTLLHKKEAQEEKRVLLQLENKKRLLKEDPVSSPHAEPARNIVTSFPSDITSKESLQPEIPLEKVDVDKDVSISEKISVAVTPLADSAPSNSEEPPLSPSSLVLEPVKEKGERPIPPPRVSSIKDTKQGSTPNFDTLVNNKGDAGSKIDIHVTVTVNPFSPGTLADLKKQRVISRASQNSFAVASASSSYSVGPPVGDAGASAGSSVHVGSMYKTPSSPTLSPRRYCGEPSDIVGTTAEEKSCCVVM